MKLPSAIAPLKVSVLPLMTKPELMSVVPRVSNLLNYHGISNKVDDSGATIGKRRITIVFFFFQPSFNLSFLF